MIQFGEQRPDRRDRLLGGQDPSGQIDGRFQAGRDQRGGRQVHQRDRLVPAGPGAGSAREAHHQRYAHELPVQAGAVPEVPVVGELLAVIRGDHDQGAIVQADIFQPGQQLTEELVEVADLLAVEVEHLRGQLPGRVRVLHPRYGVAVVGMGEERIMRFHVVQVGEERAAAFGQGAHQLPGLPADPLALGVVAPHLAKAREEPQAQ